MHCSKVACNCRKVELNCSKGAPDCRKTISREGIGIGNETLIQPHSVNICIIQRQWHLSFLDYIISASRVVYRI